MSPAIVNADGHPFTPHRNIDLMTQNVYFGTDVAGILTAPNPIVAAAQAWADVQATFILGRAQKIGDEIVDAGPELVGLQEMAHWTGPAPDGTPLDFDFLQDILDEIVSRGGHYATVRVLDETDLFVPIGFAVDGSPILVHFLDRDVLLARTDLPAAKLKLSDVQAAHFANLISVQTPIGVVTVYRGWISADAKVRGKNFRFVTTHLESFPVPFVPSIQELQGGELVSGPAATALPVILSGDFNSNANGMTGLPDDTPTYDELLAAGFEDVWPAVTSDIGNTCCQDANLENPTSNLTERLDLFLTNGGLGAAAADLIGDQPSDRINAPVVGLIWPSDHAGLFATLKIP